MVKKPTKTKLSLKKKVVRKLKGSDLEQAEGGMLPVTVEPTDYCPDAPPPAPPPYHPPYPPPPQGGVSLQKPTQGCSLNRPGGG